jgi:hypothetical protein
VPVAYPVTADWSGSPNLHIGSRTGLRPWHAAWYEPATGKLTAFRPATVTLAVTVNGVREQARIGLVAEQARATG